MVNVPTDWAWPALIQSLQNDISHLRDLMDEARRETSTIREQHRKELDGLIEQLRVVRAELEPIIEEREASRKARREMVWDWIGKGGWIVIVGAVAAGWHYIKRHLND